MIFSHKGTKNTTDSLPWWPLCLCVRNRHSHHNKRRQTMKPTTVFKAFTALAALAMGICAYSTKADGRALNAQERKLGGRTSHTDSCKVCTPGKGGTDCTYQKAIANDACTEPGAEITWCDGTKGDGRICSKTRDVYTFGSPDGRTQCLRLYFECAQTGDNPNNHVWQRIDYYDYAGCGIYTDCNDEATSNPKKCAKACGGGDGE